MAQFTPDSSNPSNDARLQNVSFPQARSDINANLEALQTLNSGPSAPGANAPYMPWLDTTQNPALLKLRHPTNVNDWITVGSINTETGAFAPQGVTAITNGGTGATTATAAMTALLPDQGGNAGKSLTTNGSALSWALTSLFNAQTFDYTGSTQQFTVPSTGSLAFVFLWGAGGSGATDNSGNGDSGGGGGGCCFGIFPLSELGSANETINISIGEGGYRSGNDQGGEAGGNSTFGTSSQSFYMKANGGEGGQRTSTGGRGGQIYDLGYATAGSSLIGGFAGGQGGNHAVVGDTGDASIFGGAGGANGNTSSHSYSVMGGNGGRGGQGNGTNGSLGDGTKSTGMVPGGGGGGRANNGSPYGAGGHGQCKIYII